MYRLVVLITFCFLICNTNKVSAQQKLDTGRMNYIYTDHPYCILYHDTLYSGSKEFRKLFYRTGDLQLINLYKQHQRNKIWGNIVTDIGTLSMLWGIVAISDSKSDASQRTIRWVATIGGLGCDIVGSILIMNGQRSLASAVHLFNTKNQKASVGIGVGYEAAGLVVNW